MPLPEWFELNAAEVRVDSGLSGQAHRIEGVMDDAGMDTLITRLIATRVTLALGDISKVAPGLPFPITAEKLKRATAVELFWPVIVAHDANCAQQRTALCEARTEASELVIPFPLELRFELRSGNPETETSGLTQDEIDQAADDAELARDAVIEQQKANFIEAVKEMVIASLWYSTVVEAESERPIAKTHWINGKNLLSALGAEMKRLRTQIRINSETPFV